MQNLYLDFGFMAPNYEPSDLCLWNFVWRRIINIHILHEGFLYIKIYKYGDDAEHWGYIWQIWTLLESVLVEIIHRNASLNSTIINLKFLLDSGLEAFQVKETS